MYLLTTFSELSRSVWLEVIGHDNIVLITMMNKVIVLISKYVLASM